MTEPVVKILEALQGTIAQLPASHHLKLSVTIVDNVVTEYALTDETARELELEERARGLFERASKDWQFPPPPWGELSQSTRRHWINSARRMYG